MPFDHSGQASPNHLKTSPAAILSPRFGALPVLASAWNWTTKNKKSCTEMHKFHKAVRTPPIANTVMPTSQKIKTMHNFAHTTAQWQARNLNPTLPPPHTLRAT